MIFVTVGSQLPFDRLIEAIDNIAPLFPQEQFVAQVFGMQYQPKHITTLDYISPVEFKNYIQEASLVISHAGTGTILSVAQLQKPLIVFPRLGRLRETRNNHQVSTCVMLEKITQLQVAYDAPQLQQKIQLFLEGRLPVMDKVPPFASQQLLSSIRTFIETPGKVVVSV